MTPELSIALNELELSNCETLTYIQLKDLARSTVDESDFHIWLDCDVVRSLEMSCEVKSLEIRDSTNNHSEPWQISLAQTFKNSMKSLSKNLKGRVMDALISIAESPITPCGDTIKPLVGELKGFWRYRIADYRIVYRPNAEKRLVQLLFIKPRDSVYD